MKTTHAYHTPHTVHPLISDSPLGARYDIARHRGGNGQYSRRSMSARHNWATRGASHSSPRKLSSGRQPAPLTPSQWYRSVTSVPMGRAGVSARSTACTSARSTAVNALPPSRPSSVYVQSRCSINSHWSRSSGTSATSFEIVVPVHRRPRRCAQSHWRSEIARRRQSARRDAQPRVKVEAERLDLVAQLAEDVAAGEGQRKGNGEAGVVEPWRLR